MTPSGTAPSGAGRDGPLRIGLVCPYSLDVAGGVQAHVVGLAAALRTRGHRVDVLAPAATGTILPPSVTSAGRAVAVPYNGSVARVAFGPLTWARTRRWLARHEFDVLHLHEPTTVSVSVLALLAATGPVVATFHAAAEHSRVLATFGGLMQPLLEKITARIAVSPTARRVQVEHLGGDAVEIPNGIDVAAFRGGSSDGVRPESIVFVGRYDEHRKGMGVLLDALTRLAPDRPELRIRVVGQGDAAALRQAAGPVADRLELLGGLDEGGKAAALRSARLLVAPHRYGESFGIVLAEAMAAGTPVLASDLDAFRALLGDPPAGALFPVGDAAALAASAAWLLDDRAAAATLAAAGRARVVRFDWPVVAASVERVYRAAVAADPRRMAAPGSRDVR